MIGKTNGLVGVSAKKIGEVSTQEPNQYQEDKFLLCDGGVTNNSELLNILTANGGSVKLPSYRKPAYIRISE